MEFIDGSINIDIYNLEKFVLVPGKCTATCSNPGRVVSLEL